MNIRTAYSNRLKTFKPHPGVKFNPEENRVQTVPKEVTDINSIMKKARETGILGNPNQKLKIPMYRDCTLVGTYEEIQSQVADIKSKFIDLPSSVREELENDPANLVKIVTSNDPEAVKFCAENKIGDMFGIEYIERPAPVKTPVESLPENPKESTK